MAVVLGVEQENVSRLERRANLMLSTLSSHVAARGGKLWLVVEFPIRKPVVVGLGDLASDGAPKPRSRGIKMQAAR
jgi:hypothetical protein